MLSNSQLTTFSIDQLIELVPKFILEVNLLKQEYKDVTRDFLHFEKMLSGNEFRYVSLNYCN
jgi:hypothetical protein